MVITNNKTVLILGSSSDIGVQTARIFLEKKWKVIGHYNKSKKKIADLPPGFENGNNSRFSRKIGLECMSCHNAYPEHIEGSLNKYKSILTGIDCERCHGPGEVHIKKIKTKYPMIAGVFDWEYLNAPPDNDDPSQWARLIKNC